MPKLENSSISLCYEAVGIKHHPCIILINGINGQLINWPEIIIKGLVDQGFYVVIFDNRDMGLSRYYDDLITPNLSDAITAKQSAIHFDPPYTLDDMAADVIALMDELQIEKSHIAGISMGGMIGQIIALKYTQRVLSLTCIATTSADSHLPPPKPNVLEFFFADKKPIADINSYVNHMMESYKIYHHPDHLDETYAQALYAKSYQRAYHPEGFIRQLLAIMFAEPRGEKLKRLQIPSLIFHGDYDPVFTIEHAYYLHECLTNSRLEIVEKMGHGLPDFVSLN